jgi:hypothetical protein
MHDKTRWLMQNANAKRNWLKGSSMFEKGLKVVP